MYITRWEARKNRESCLSNYIACMAYNTARFSRFRKSCWCDIRDREDDTTRWVDGWTDSPGVIRFYASWRDGWPNECAEPYHSTVALGTRKGCNKCVSEWAPRRPGHNSQSQITRERGRREREWEMLNELLHPNNSRQFDQMNAPRHPFEQPTHPREPTNPRRHCWCQCMVFVQSNVRW